ncbi:unnamed protein product [Tilletia controversa]|uniref:TPR-like protein n=3 Tax=Tilletia TaxID=13289 RepID=A0A8X7MWZ3_9BASI|nr:hypothetical protein CF328_g3998 [Tilletia controversa]KAE8200720.1 hypothetical protein CF336_g548 [Tilletia laevis]KAE8259110.1 hypothetical protein A4X03_0g4189 [Tilletia caries]KAE8204577.1 hypothetical protein CF335_g2604 [Tilletia laevis]KAE8251064.1 hypothetical protein A4X06_0g2828 [Tilletia controversa]
MERIATPESRAILTHDRLIGLANRFLTGISTDAAASSSSSRAASRLPTLPTPDYITAAFFSFLALARFPNSIPARRLLAACILAGADPFPFSPSTSAGCPSPVTAAPGLLIGGISSAAAHAAISLLQGGPAGVYEDVGCATLFAQASSALSAFSEAHDALSWTVDHASGFRSRLAAMNARGKAPAGLAGLGIIPGIVTPAAGPSQTRSEHIQDEGNDGTAALLASLTSSAADPSTSNLRPSQPIKVLVSPRQTSTSLAQQSQTLTSLGHLAAKGNRLAEAASSFESALDADRWNWAAWAGLCDVARVGSQRGVVDGGNCTDTLKRWSHTELGLHGLEEFLPDNMADWEALLVQLVAQEAEAETKWRQLGGGSGIAAPGGAGASQSQSQSQPQSSASQGGTASSQSQATSRLKASTNGASAQLEKGRSGTGTAGSNGLPTFVRAGSRTTTGARSTAAGNPGSNKRARSGLDGSVSSSTRNAASRSVPAFPGPSSENRTAAGAGSRSAIASSASARTLTTARTNVGSHALSRSQGHPSRADTGESAMGLADDELMLVDDMPATESGAALVEGRQNLLEDAAPVGLVREFEKGALVRRSTRTNAQAAAGAAAARTRVGAGTGAAVGGGIAAGRRVGGAVPGTVTGLRTGTGAGRGPQSTTTVSKSTALGRSQAGSAQGRVPAGASSSSSSTASRAGGMTSTRPDALGGRAPKSSSSTDSSLGTGSVTSLALPGRSDAAASATGKGTRRLGVAGATNGTTGTSNAAAAALSAAAAELDSVRAKRVEAEARISDAKAAASQVAQLWSDVDMDVLSTVRQLAEAYRTVRLYEGRKTAYLLRSVDDVTRALLGTMATTEEQQAELATNRAVYGDSPFSLGISDAVLNTEPVRCLLGRAAHDSARYAEAERHFDAARRNIAQPSSSCSSAIVPTRHMDIFSLVLFHLNREVKLSALAQDLGLLDANAAETHIACGNAFALQREHAQAMRAFKRAALIAPGCAYAYTLAGYEAIELSQLERAVGFFRSAIRVDMRHWNAWAGLGQIFLKIQKTDWAEAHYREAIGINPHHAVLKDLLGYTFETQGRWKEALDEYDAALAMSPKLAMTRLKRAELLSHMENYEDAHEELLRVAELVPDESRVHILLAKSYMRLGHGQFADPNYGSTGGGGDKSTSMAAQEPVPPSAYHEEIAFHLAAAIDLDPKNVRIVKAMGEGARTALKGGRRTVDMSAMDSTVDSSMYPVDQSGEVFEDGPEESGASRVTDEAMAEGALPSEDDEDDEEDLDDEDDEDDEDDDDVSDGEDGEDSDDDESDGTGEEEEDEGDSDGDDRIPGHDEDESENVEPRQTAAGEDSENAYRGRANRHAQNAQPQQQQHQHQHQPSMPSPGQAAANLSVSTTSSAAAGMSASTGDGSMFMSEEQSMELDI